MTKVWKKLSVVIGAPLIIGGAYLASQNLAGRVLPRPDSSETKDDNSQQLRESVQPPLLKSKGSAPELLGIKSWINGEEIKIADSKGRVILLNFWTSSNIQSIRLLETIKKLQEKYGPDGLAVIGVHTPQFKFEKVDANIKAAIERYHLNYPIALDNDYKTWQAYQNQFWPSVYLIDKNGEIVLNAVGEDADKHLEQSVRTLLGLEGEFDVQPAEDSIKIPDINLGTAKLKKYVGSEKPQEGEQIYTFPSKMKAGFALEGKWSFNQESAMHTQGVGKLKLKFKARKVFMVAKSPSQMTVKVSVDGAPHKGVVVSQAQIYELYASQEEHDGILELEIPYGGLEIFSFTFN